MNSADRVGGAGLDGPGAVHQRPRLKLYNSMCVYMYMYIYIYIERERDR